MRNVYELTNSASASYRKALRLLLILFVDRKFSVILGVLLFQLSRKQSAIRVCGHQKHAPVTRNPCHVTPPARWIHARHPVWTKTGKAWTWPWTSNILFKQATSHTHTHTHTHCVVFVTFARHRSSRRCRAASVSFPSATRISIFVLACPSVDPFHQCLTSSAPHFAKFHAAFVSPLNGASPPPVAVSRVTLRRYGFFFSLFASRFHHANTPTDHQH